ncbi:PREDICTED: FAST kinase domain-containing protein 5, mitochondrial [Rhagoletis zephyria]|uniref:FAST kinase domain-containing protein 5, mitochondrial n=1 Tax=Rhagoletis zephyria TaxID=28612 RepID=UPI00081153AC|nr:PREDICTED: FAST kinase domain-containing protein 5, mitochondrial [Rhagoletis zephyria]
MLSVPTIRFRLSTVQGIYQLLVNQPRRIPLKQPPIACLHLSHPNTAKLFVDKENKHAHDVLEHSLKPYKIFRLDVSTQTKNFSEHPQLPSLALTPKNTDSTIEELFSAFTALTQYCIHTNTCISDQRFTQFCLRFCEQTHHLNDEELLTTLRQLAQLPLEDSVREHNYVELWNNLDVECCRRIDRWSSDELLLACDAWYTLNLARVSEFVWEALRKLGRKVRRMQPEHLVQAMFYCNVLRRPVFEMFDFEVNLARCVDSMSLQELGVMSMGFFKTQTPIRNPDLLDHLYNRLIAETETVDDITLVAILKVLRYSSKLPQVPQMMQLMEVLQEQVSRISLMSCLHLALFGVELQCCHDGVLELVLQRFNNEIANARLKDMERICLAISVFNYRSPTGVEQELCRKIISLLQTKVDEVMKYPRCFAACLHYLTLCGYHNEEMLTSALDKRFIDHAYGKNVTLGREIFNLDSFVKINLKDSGYTGNQLSEKMRRSMGKMLTQYIPERNSKFRLNNTDRILLEIKETFERILRPNTFKHILPHFERPDLVICYDNKNRKAIRLAAGCPEDYSGDILTRQLLLGDSDRPEVDTIAIVIAGWNNVVKDKQRFTGLFEMKLNQLRMLGHKPIVIYWHEWRAQETPLDRQQFLKRKLVNAINF